MNLKIILIAITLIIVLTLSFCGIYIYLMPYKNDIGYGILLYIYKAGIIIGYIIISILWILYLIYIGKYKFIGLFFIIPLIFVSYLIINIINKKIEENIEEQKEKVWLLNVQEKEFISKDLGIKFNYLSDSKYGENFFIKEDIKNNTINFRNSKNIVSEGNIKVFNENIKEDFITFLTKKYEKEFPYCRFYEINEIKLPDDFLVVKAGENYQKAIQDGGGTFNKYRDKFCPKIGTEINDINNYFIMKKGNTKKYIYLNLKDSYSIKASKDSYNYWFQTIDILK